MMSPELVDEPLKELYEQLSRKKKKTVSGAMYKDAA
jgi:hypothetical protein